MDWSDDDLSSLGDLDIHYSGVSSVYDEVYPEKSEFSVSIPSRSFCTTEAPTTAPTTEAPIVLAYKKQSSPTSILSR